MKKASRKLKEYAKKQSKEEKAVLKEEKAVPKEEKRAAKEEAPANRRYYLTGNIGGHRPLFVRYARKQGWNRDRVPKKTTSLAILGDPYVPRCPVISEKVAKKLETLKTPIVKFADVDVPSMFGVPGKLLDVMKEVSKTVIFQTSAEKSYSMVTWQHDKVPLCIILSHSQALALVNTKSLTCFP